MASPSYTDLLAEFAAVKRFEDLPESARLATKRLILDTLGCCVAAYELPSSQILTKVVGAMGGIGEATVLVGGQKLPATQAAYLNAHYGDVIDGEDTLHYKGHISAPLIGAALAIAERQNASGADLITAVALGYEVAGRISLALKGLVIDDAGGFKFAPVTGYSALAFGSAVAAGWLLRLTDDQMHNAFGIVGATTPVPASSKFGLHRPRPMVKNTMYGTLGNVGAMAALLAKEGFTGERHILDGDQGFWRVVGSLGFDWDVLTDRLGSRWLIEEVSYKPYPGCRFLHSPIDMFLALTQAHRLTVAEIERVEVNIHGAAMQRRMDDPEVTTMIDALFSQPYLIAAAALLGPPGPGWHTPQARANENVKAFARKVHVALEPTAAAIAAEDLRTLGHNARMPASITIFARGEAFSAKAHYAFGDAFTPETMMSDIQLDQKFRNFCNHSLSSDQIDRALGSLHKLECLPNLDPLMGALVRSQEHAPPTACAVSPEAVPEPAYA